MKLRVALLTAALAAMGAMAIQIEPKSIHQDDGDFPLDLNITLPSANYTIEDMILDHPLSSIHFQWAKSPVGNKESKLAQPADVCINSYGGYVVVISNGTNINDGDAACGQYGFEWAVVNSDTVYNLYRTMIGCDTYFGSIRSYNGYNSSTCSITLLGALFEVDLPEYLCDQPLVAFICQEIPRENVTITSYSTVTTEYVTTTVTEVVQPTCPGCKLHTCPYSKSNFHIIQEPIPYRQARCACRELGMELADIDILTFLDATDVEFQCVGAFKKAWIQSWNGDKYHHSCLALSTGVMAPGGSINVPACCEDRLPVICKANPCYQQCKPCWGNQENKPCNSCPQECRDNWWPEPCSDSDDHRCWPFVDNDHCPCRNWGQEEWNDYCHSDGHHCDNSHYGGNDNNHHHGDYGYNNNQNYYYQGGNNQQNYLQAGYQQPYGGRCPCSSSYSAFPPTSHHGHGNETGFIAGKKDIEESQVAKTAPQQLVELNAKPGIKDQKANFNAKTAKDYPEMEDPDGHHHHDHDIHILQGQMNWDEAIHACRSHGWRLLDVTYQNIEQLKYLLSRYYLHDPLWVRSWFFFDAGECRGTIPYSLPPPAVKDALKNDNKVNIKSGLRQIPGGNKSANQGPLWLVGMFAEYKRICLEELFVLCQEYPRVPAEPTGPIEVSTSYSYTTTTSYVSYTSEVRTVTRTITWRGDDHHDYHHHQRDYQQHHHQQHDDHDDDYYDDDDDENQDGHPPHHDSPSISIPTHHHHNHHDRHDHHYNHHDHHHHDQ